MDYNQNYFATFFNRFSLSDLFKFAVAAGGKPSYTEPKEVVINFLLSKKYVPGSLTVVASEDPFFGAVLKEVIASAANPTLINPTATFQKSAIQQLTQTFSQMNLSQGASQVPSQLNLSQVPSQLNLSQVPSQLNVNQVPSQLNVNQVPSQFNVGQVSGQLSVGQVPSQLNVNQVPSQFNVGQVSGQVPIQLSAGQVPSQALTPAILTQISQAPPVVPSSNIAPVQTFAPTVQPTLPIVPVPTNVTIQPPILPATKIPTINIAPLPVPAPGTKPVIPAIKTTVPLQSRLNLPSGSSSAQGSNFFFQLPVIDTTEIKVVPVTPEELQAVNYHKYISEIPYICAKGKGCRDIARLREIARDLGLNVSGAKANYVNSILTVMEHYTKEKYPRH